MPEIARGNFHPPVQAVKNLRNGEEGTIDHPEPEAVPLWVIAATLPFLAPVVAAMVQIQWMLGMRPSEVFKMLVGDIDRIRENGLTPSLSMPPRNCSQITILHV